MWSYVFSPRLMAIDAACGVAFFVFFRLLLGRERTVPELLASMLLMMLVERWFGGGLPAARALPAGYVGDLVRACQQTDDTMTCFCAVDALETAVGHPAVVRLGVRAVANGFLPPEVDAEIARCRGRAAEL